VAEHGALTAVDSRGELHVASGVDQLYQRSAHAACRTVHRNLEHHVLSE
jgi:hypothetical protein